MLDELVQRGALRIALSGRSEENLVPVLKFVTRHITNPHFADLLHDTALVLLGMFRCLRASCCLPFPHLDFIRVGLQ